MKLYNIRYKVLNCSASIHYGAIYVRQKLYISLFSRLMKKSLIRNFARTVLAEQRKITLKIVHENMK